MWGWMGLSSFVVVDVVDDVVGMVTPAKENKYVHSGRSDCNSAQDMDKMGRVKRCFT